MGVSGTLLKFLASNLGERGLDSSPLLGILGRLTLEKSYAILRFFSLLLGDE